MARVRLPFFSASLATRDISRGPSAIFSASIAACVPALACTVPTSLTSRTRPSALSTFTASRAARTAAAGSVTEAPARLTADQSTTSRSERLMKSAIRPPSRPAFRAALTAVRPSRAGVAAPTDA
jgi:hypothetical protein